MPEGLLKKDILRETSKRKVPSNFVTVSIEDKDGYKWKAEGNAGMVVIAQGEHSEVDFIGQGEDLARLLATALIKIGEMTSPKIVAMAINKYYEK